MTDEQQAKEMEEKISRLQACQDKLDNLELYATAKVGSVTVTRIPEGLIYGVGSTAVFVQDYRALVNQTQDAIEQGMEFILTKVDQKIASIVEREKDKAPTDKGTPVAGAAPKKAAPKKVATKK